MSKYYVLNKIYYNATVGKHLSRDYFDIDIEYGYPLTGLRSKVFTAFCKDSYGDVYIYDYAPLATDKRFIELVSNYYTNRVVRHTITSNIELEIEKHISKRASKIKLGYSNLNNTTLLQDTILNNVAILNKIYVDAQEESILTELNGPCQIN